MANSYVDEINLGDGIVYGVNFLAVEKNKYLHQDEYLKIEKEFRFPKFLLRCVNVDL